jgi:hypothetical protein
MMFVVSFDVVWDEVEKQQVTVPTWCAKVVNTLLMGFKPTACSNLLAGKKRVNVLDSNAGECCVREHGKCCSLLMAVHALNGCPSLEWLSTGTSFEIQQG